MMKTYFLLFVLLSLQGYAQTGIGTTIPDASAKLDVFSTTKGFLPPRMTSSQRTSIPSPAVGLMVYQTDGTTGLYYYNGAWIYIINSTTNVVSVVNGGTGTTTATGTGSVVLNISPSLITPALGTPSSATLTNATGLPISTGVSGLANGVSSFLVTPTSSNLANVVTDETGSGALVFGTSPTLTTPILGVASGASLALTGTTPSTSNSTGAMTVAGGAGIGGALNASSVTTSSLIVPTITGGSGTTQTLTFKPTSGNGATGADHIFQVGNNGGTEAMRILNNGNVGIGTNTTTEKLEVNGNIKATNFIGSGSQLTNVLTKVTGSWVLAPNSNNVNFSLPAGGTYAMWVYGNIPNGIAIWNATVTTANTNVPVVGSQYGWYYSSGNALVLNSIPDQIVGTNNSIITNQNAYAPNTSNIFRFVITNNSGASQTIYYGYTRLD